MPRVCLSLLAVCLLAVGLPARAEVEAMVVGVIDGDRIVVEVNGAKQEVQLAGVVCPDASRPKKRAEYYGQEASKLTQNLALGQLVTIAPDPSYPDSAAASFVTRTVTLGDGRDLAREILSAGAGEVDRRSSRAVQLQVSERDAKRGYRGMWDPKFYAVYEKQGNTAYLDLPAMGIAAGFVVENPDGTTFIVVTQAIGW